MNNDKNSIWKMMTVVLATLVLLFVISNIGNLNLIDDSVLINFFLCAALIVIMVVVVGITIINKLDFMMYYLTKFIMKDNLEEFKKRLEEENNVK